MTYIKTKDGKISVLAVADLENGRYYPAPYREDTYYEKEDIVNQSKRLDDLCDCYFLPCLCDGKKILLMFSKYTKPNMFYWEAGKEFKFPIDVLKRSEIDKIRGATITDSEILFVTKINIDLETELL